MCTSWHELVTWSTESVIEFHFGFKPSRNFRTLKVTFDFQLIRSVDFPRCEFFILSQPLGVPQTPPWGNPRGINPQDPQIWESLGIALRPHGRETQVNNGRVVPVVVAVTYYARLNGMRVMSSIRANVSSAYNLEAAHHKLLRRPVWFRGITALASSNGSGPKERRTTLFLGSLSRAQHQFTLACGHTSRPPPNRNCVNLFRSEGSRCGRSVRSKTSRIVCNASRAEGIVADSCTISPSSKEHIVRLYKSRAFLRCGRWLCNPNRLFLIQVKPGLFASLLHHKWRYKCCRCRLARGWLDRLLPAYTIVPLAKSETGAARAFNVVGGMIGTNPLFQQNPLVVCYTARYQVSLLVECIKRLKCTQQKYQLLILICGFAPQRASETAGTLLASFKVEARHLQHLPDTQLPAVLCELLPEHFQTPTSARKACRKKRVRVDGKVEACARCGSHRTNLSKCDAKLSPEGNSRVYKTALS
jgi:hypothetical protein